MNNYPIYPYDSERQEKPVVVVGHANGFPPQMYEPLAQALGDSYYRVCLLGRPWWKNEDPNDFHSWHQLADDFVGAIRENNFAPVIAIGHSMSAVAFTYAATEHPELFRAIILIDPVNLPPSIIRFVRLGTALGYGGFHKLIEGALKRRREWASLDEAYERFRSRSLFNRCSDDMVRRYAEGLTRPKSNGEGVELAYSPEWEARIFKTGALDVWKYPKRLTVPTLVIGGAESDTFMKPAKAAWQKKRPDIPLIDIPETGHMLPFEQPESTAYHILDFLAKLKH